MPSVLAGLWLCFGLAILGSRFDSFRLRAALLFAITLALVVVGRALLRGWRPVVSLPVVLILGCHLAIVGLAAVTTSTGGTAYNAAVLLILTGLGWLALIEVRAGANEPEVRQDIERVRWTAIIALLPAATALALAHAFHETVHAPLVQHVDELLYLMQANMVARDSAAWAVAPELLPLFRLPDVAYATGSLLPLSAPGWPLFLSWVMGGGVENVIGLVLTVLNVVLTAVIGRRMLGAVGAGLAALFVAVNPIALRYGPTLHAHAATLTLLLTATLLLLRAQDEARTPSGRVVHQVSAGGVLALAMLMRPFAALAIAIAVVTWVHLREAGSTGARRGALLRIACGCVAVLLIPVALHAFRFGPPWRVAHRLALLPGGGGLPSVAELVKATWFSFGAAGLFAIAGLLAHYRIRPPAAVAPFLLLPVWNLAWPSSTVISYYEMVPFAGLAFGWAMLEVHQRAARAARAFTGLTLFGALAVSCLLLVNMAQAVEAPGSLAATVERARASYGRILVIIPRSASAEIAARMWSYNVAGLDGPVVVAREGEREATRQLLARFADRRPFALLRVAEDRWMLWPVESAVDVAERNGMIPRLHSIPAATLPHSETAGRI